MDASYYAVCLSLPGLTQVEEMLISCVLPMMSLIYPMDNTPTQDM